MQQSMVQFCLPRVPFQRSQIKLWQPVCSAVKLLACRKKASFHCWKKNENKKRSIQVQTKLTWRRGGAWPFASLMAMHQKCWHNLCSNFSVMYLLTWCTHMLNRRGIPRVECHGVFFPRKTHTKYKNGRGGWRHEQSAPSGLVEKIRRCILAICLFGGLCVSLARLVGLVMLFVQVPPNRIVNKLRLLLFSQQRAWKNTAPRILSFLPDWTPVPMATCSSWSEWLTISARG